MGGLREREEEYLTIKPKYNGLSMLESFAANT